MKEDKAIVLSDETVREGHVITVFNKKKKDEVGVDYFYIIHVQKNKKEFAIALTKEEFDNAIMFAEANKEDIPKKSLF